MENKSKYQNFTFERINRSDIKNAKYNPRIIDDEARKRLKNGLKEHGLVSAITWNKRTGNLVGGHQRLSQLDSLERSQNYSLDVCVIDVDERKEKILNVQLNNPSMQGVWDLDMLSELILDNDIEFDELGFDDTDVALMFDGDERFTGLYEGDKVLETKDKLNDVKNARSASVDDMNNKNSLDWYSVLVFPDEKARREFYKKINVPFSEEYLTIDELNRYFNSSTE